MELHVNGGTVMTPQALFGSQYLYSFPCLKKKNILSYENLVLEQGTGFMSLGDELFFLFFIFLSKITETQY